jgi:hypothetical protein
MVMTYVSGDSARAEKVLRPFRETLKPIVDNSVSLPHMLAVSHVADGNFENTPRRLTMRGAIVSDIWTDAALNVWERWRIFTEKTDCERTLVIWEECRGEKMEGIGRADTAYHARDPHYCVTIQGRYVKISSVCFPSKTLNAYGRPQQPPPNI